MTRRNFKIYLSLSTTFPFRNPTPISHFHNFSLLTLPSIFTRLLTTTTTPPPTDNLDGLFDPEFNPIEDSGVQFSLDQELSILRDSMLDPPRPDIEPKIASFCKSKFSDDAYLISNAIKNNNDGFGDKTQKFLRRYREKLSESLVVDVLKLVQNAELGVKFFKWAGRQIGYSHTPAVYNVLLDVLGCGGNYDRRVSDNFLREIKDDDENVLGKLLNVLIRKFCRYGSWNAALEELGRLRDFGYKPSRETYNALVQVFLEVDKTDTAYLVQREMADMGYRMDAHTLGCFTSSLCKTGRWREALDLIEKEEFSSDTILYTRMISGLCEGSYFEEAMEFLNRMRASSCIPNVVTYRTLLCWCLNKKKLGRCKRILSMMITEGCYPSPQIFNSLVHAYCKSGDYSYAYKLLRKMMNCGCQPGYVVYNIFVGGICGNDDLPSSDLLSLAEKAYNEMLDVGVVLNKVNVSNFARCLCGAGRFEKAYKIIHEMMSKGFMPDVSTYSKVISFLCNVSKVEKAFLLFEEMKKNGIVPDVHTYTILIDSFCKAGFIRQARTWFDEMVKDGCSPNVVTYTALIHAYLKARKVPDANELFELMLSEGCIPNIVTFTALIDGHCKAGDIEKACQIYSRMRGKEVADVNMYFKGEDSNNMDPNVVTYGALVDGLCKVHRVEQARELLDTMCVDGCEPNHIVYDALIDGFCKVGKLDEAQKVFAKMSEHGYRPDVFMYGSFIDRLFKDKQLDLALRVLSQMLESSCPPNVIIYTAMIDGLCKVGKTDEAYRLMLMMEAKGCHPNVITYTAMIDGFGKNGRVEKGLELFKQMCDKNCAPNYVTYWVLVSHCCATGLLEEAYQLLEEMKQTYWPTHMASYRKVIDGFNKDFIINLGLLEEIGDYDSVPIVPVYMILMDSFRKAGKLEVAVELYKEISSSLPFSSTNKNMYYSLIEKLCLAHKVDKAFELYMDIISKGAAPELSVFSNLIKGLILVNRWEEALQLSHSVCCMDIQWLINEDTEGK